MGHHLPLQDSCILCPTLALTFCQVTGAVKVQIVWPVCPSKASLQSQRLSTGHRIRGPRHHLRVLASSDGGLGQALPSAELLPTGRDSNSPIALSNLSLLGSTT